MVTRADVVQHYERRDERGDTEKVLTRKGETEK